MNPVNFVAYDLPDPIAATRTSATRTHTAPGPRSGGRDGSSRGVGGIRLEECGGGSAGVPVTAAGATGRASGPHVHWGFNWFDVRLDPALLPQSNK